MRLIYDKNFLPRLNQDKKDINSLNLNLGLRGKYNKAIYSTSAMQVFSSFWAV